MPIAVLGFSQSGILMWCGGCSIDSWLVLVVRSQLFGCFGKRVDRWRGTNFSTKSNRNAQIFLGQWLIMLWIMMTWNQIQTLVLMTCQIKDLIRNDYSKVWLKRIGYMADNLILILAWATPIILHQMGTILNTWWLQGSLEIKNRLRILWLWTDHKW